MEESPDAPPPSRDALAARAEAGERTVTLRLHGARAEVHDWVAGAETFRDTLDALVAARGLGMRVTVLTALTRSNARVLAELPSLLRARGVKAWRLAVPRFDDEGALVGRAARLALGLPAALAALDRARKLGVQIEVEGAPLCLLGPLRALAVASEARAYADRCGGCALRPSCPGVDAAYLARFGPGELRPSP